MKISSLRLFPERSNPVLLIHLCLILACCWVSPARAGNETMSTGAFIINMGATNPNTIANGIKPYGLIYDLLRNYNVPVKWVIGPGKLKDGADFTYNGNQYKGGTFIIPAEFRTAAVNARITFWQGQGVVGVTTVSPLTVFVNNTITAAPRWTLDAQNGAIAQGYLNNAGITLTAFPNAYNWKAPSTLDCCDDFFVMPHADPVWSTHGRLLSWNKDCLGSVWAACHAVSALEDMVNPADRTQQTNFLSQKDPAYTGTSGNYTNSNALTLWTAHSGGSIPYTHRLFDDPVAQYLGTTDAAMLNGSEQIYLPRQGATTARWNAGAKIVAYDPTQVNVPVLNPDLSNAAAVMVYGRGFDDTTRGYVMYEAGHSHNKGSAADVAAQRAFFNFSFFQILPKAPALSTAGITSGQAVQGGASISPSVSASSPLTGIVFTYNWISSCGGTFSNASSSNPTFTAPVVGVNTPCIITAEVSDQCGRKSFISIPIVITAGPQPPTAVNDNGSISGSCTGTGSSITIDVLSNDSDPSGLSLSVSNVSGNNGTWTTNGTTVTFVPNSGFTGTATATYQVCNTTPLCSNATITVGVGTADSNGCYPGTVWDVASVDTATTQTNNSVTNAPGAFSADYEDGFGDSYAILNNATDSLVLDFGSIISFDAAKKILVSAASGNATSVTGTIYSRTTIGGARTLIGTITNTDNTTQTEQEYNFPASGLRYLVIYRTAGTADLRVDAMVINNYGCVSAALVGNTDNVLVQEDNALVIDVTANDVNPGDLPLTLTVLQGPAIGKLSINQDTTITYLNNTDVSGLDSFTYQICNTQGLCSTAKVYLTVRDDSCTAGNYKPLDFSSPTITTFSGTTLTVDGQIREDNATTNYGTNTTTEIGKKITQRRRFIIGIPNNTTVNSFRGQIPANAVITAATLRFTVTGGDNSQTIPFSVYRLSGNPYWDEGTMTWNIRRTGTNWTSAGADFITTPLSSNTLTRPGTADNGDQVTFDILSAVSAWHNDTTTNRGILLAQTLTRSPQINKRFIFGTSENGTAGNRPLYTITYVTPLPCTSIPNRAPLANPDTISTPANQQVSVVVLNNDADQDAGNTISLSSVVGSVSGGSAIVSGNTIIFTPNGTFNGTTTFRYRMVDNSGLADTAWITVRVLNVAPLAVRNDTSLNSGASISIPVKNNDLDYDGPASTAPLIIRNALNGLSIVSANNINYTPNAGFSGKDTIIYEICEGSSSGCNASVLCDTALVVITVVNQPPVAVRDTKTTNQCQLTNINVLTNDSDPENGDLTVTITRSPGHGSAALSAGVITYTPDVGYAGPTDTIIYNLCDNGSPALCDTALIVITINGIPTINNKPLAYNDTTDVVINNTAYWDILTNDSDPDNDNLLATVPPGILAPSNGVVSILPNGLLMYTPNFGFSGNDSMDYVVCDDVAVDLSCPPISSKCDTARFYVIITNPSVDGSPTADMDAVFTNEDVPLDIYVLANDSFGVNGPGDTVAITITDDPGYGVAVVDDNGTPADPADDYIVYTPNANYYGYDTLIYQLCDIDGDCDTAIVYITVNAVDEFPVAVMDTVSVQEDFSITGATVAPNDSLSNDGGNTFNIGCGVCATTTNGTLTFSNDGSYDYTPDPDFNGTDQFVYQLCDTDGDCDTAIVYITVNAVNDVPVANADQVSVNEDVSLSGATVVPNDVLSGDGGNTFNIGCVVCASTSNGTLTFNNTGTYDYTPNPDFNGTDQFVYQLCDTDGDCDTAIVYITVNPVNDTPTADADNVSVNEDASATFPVLNNDTFGGDGPSATDITITQNPANGTATVNTNGTPNDPTDDQVDYTPNADFNGNDTLIYEICDSNGDCDTAIVYITVNPVNDTPTADADNVSVDEDDSASFPVLNNDTFGGDGPSATDITITQNPVNGTATVNTNGTPNDPTDDEIDYTPNANFNGADTLIYEICDSNGDCDTAIVYITVNPVNDTPTADADNVSVDEDDSATFPALNNDTFGGDGPSATDITITQNPVNGTATVNTNGTPNDPTDDQVDYTPNADFNGNDTLIYEICDSNGDCDTAIVYITVNPVNDTPTADADNVSVNEDASVTFPALNNDTFGGDGPSATDITITQNPVNGTATVNTNGTLNDPTDDEIDYTPNADFNGADTLVYQICDANGDCDTAIVYITVNPVNDTPTADADNVSVDEDDSASFPVLNNDTFGGDGPSATDITITQNPANGTATVNTNGTLNDPTDDQVDYTPNADFNGNDTLIYEICDSNGDCDTAIVYITVNPVNDTPIADADNVSVAEDDSASFPVLNNDTFGGDGPSNTDITITQNPVNGTATVNTNGTPNDPTDDQVDYNPNANFNGADTLIYEICDANGDCDTAIVYITVNPVNDTPTADADNVSVDEDDSASFPVLNNDTFGGDGPSATDITITQNPTNGTAAVNTNGTPNDPTDDQVDYTPNANFNGADTLIYEICDANGDCDTAIVYITVNPVNDTPTADADNVSVDEDDSASFPVLNNDTFGGDGPSATDITLTQNPVNGTATVNTNGTPNDPTDDQVDYTPNADFNGADTLVYEICDANGDCDTAIVYITIFPLNDPPTVPDTTVTIPEDSLVTVCLPITDIDAGDSWTASLCGGPSNGTLTSGPSVTGSDVCITYVPNANWNGTDSLCLITCDLAGLCDTSIIEIIVTPQNDPPLVPDTTVTIPEDSLVTVCVPITDIDTGDSWTASLCGGPSNGTLTSGPSVTGNDVCITYVPNANWNGTDSICIITCDLGGLCDTSIIEIIVTPKNDPPFVPDTTVTIPEDSLAVVCVPITDIDAGDSWTVSLCGGPSNGTLTNGPSVTGSDVCITYVPNANWNGTDSICLITCDLGGLCDTSIIEIIVTPKNDPPFVPDTTVTIPEDSLAVVCVPITDIDAGDSWTVSLCGGPSNGTLTNGPSVTGSDVCITYVPNANWNGTDSLCLITCDLGGLCDTSIVTIIVTPRNDPPTVPDTTVTIPEDSLVTVCLPITDIDAGDNWTANLCGGPSNGTLTSGPLVTGSDVCITYVPNANWNGTDSICLITYDFGGLCDTSIVTIIVTPRNDPPTVPDTTVTIPEDSLAVVCLPITDIDAGDSWTASLCGGPSNGTLTSGPLVTVSDVCITYVPNANWNGTDSLCIITCDLDGLCDTSIIEIIVTPRNDPPFVPDTIVTIPEDSLVTVCVPITDIDAGDSWTASLCGGPNNGTLTSGPSVTGSDVCITYVPNANWNGTDSLCVITCDLSGLCDTSIIEIIVTPRNDPPFVPDTTMTIPEDSLVTVCLPITDIDAGDSWTASLCGGPSNGTLTSGPSVTGSDVCITYVPNANWNGTDSICLITCDLAGLCDTSLIQILVTPQNDPPFIPDTTVTIPEDSLVTVCVPITDIDAGDNWTVSLCGGPSNGTLTSGPSVTGSDVCITYVPNANWNGTDSLCIITCDLGGLCDTSIIEIIVTPKNDPPFVPDTTVTIPEDSLVTVCVPITDIDTGDSWMASLCGGPSNGTLTSGPSVTGSDVCITYVPNANWNGTDSLCIITCDLGGLCDTSIVTIIVTPRNDPPFVPDTTVMIPEDSLVTVCVPITDIDAGDSWTASLCGGPNNGTLTSGPSVTGSDVCITYVPNVGWNGTDSLCIIVCDNAGACDTAVVEIIVTCKTRFVTQDTTICEGRAVTVGINTYSTGGTYVDTLIAALGCDSIVTTNLTVIPRARFTQSLTICRGDQVNVGASSYTVTGTYLDTLVSASGCDSIVTTYLNVNYCDTIVVPVCDTCTEIACLGSVTGIADGVWTFCDGSQETTTGLGHAEIDSVGCITYVPNGIIGYDTLCIVVCDSVTSDCDTLSFVVDVNPTIDILVDTGVVNTPKVVCIPLEPGMQADNISIVNCGHQNNSGNTYAIDTAGCVTITRGNTPGFNLDTLCVIVCDAALQVCDTTLLVASNLPVNDRDTTVFDSLPVGNIDTICVITPAGDVVVKACNDSTSGSTDLGTWALDSAGCLYYQAGNVKGNDTLCIRACDTITGTCYTTTVIITVTGLPPVAVNDTVRTTPNTPVTIPVLDNDTSYDNEPVDLCDGTEIITQPEHGTVVINGNGTITYTPESGYAGVDSFEYGICDVDGGDTGRVIVYIVGCDIPDAFTPNGDGINDRFYIPCIGENPAFLAVYNRWGIEVYRNEQYDNSWEGNYQGSPLPDGTYYYVLRYTNTEGQRVDQASFLVIHR